MLVVYFPANSLKRLDWNWRPSTRHQRAPVLNLDRTASHSRGDRSNLDLPFAQTPWEGIRMKFLSWLLSFTLAISVFVAGLTFLIDE
jgi:hypothetical protein